MGTQRTFQDMLNDHLNYDLLKEELLKRDYILSKVERDDEWIGGDLPVPFKAAGASSVAFGGLTASNDIAEDKMVRGSITTQPEAWGSLLFNHRDLMEHGKVSEKNFLKILPDIVDDFMDYMKMVVSLNLTNGSSFAKLTANSTAGGVITVDRIDRFVINQKVGLKGTGTSLQYFYVTAINMDDNKATLSASRGGAAADLSVYTLADAGKCYFDGSLANGFSSLKLSMLSAANGGTSTLYGQTKTAYPYLQSINISGSGLTASNIVERIFDAYTTIRIKGKGNPHTVLMSFKHLGSVMKALESSKGAYHIVQDSTKVTAYGWTEIQIMGVKGVLTVVGILEMDDDWIAFIDWKALKFHSNGFFRKRVSPDGKEYYEVRATTGYYYISDVCLFGDLVLNRPSCTGIIHTISY